MPQPCLHSLDVGARGESDVQREQVAAACRKVIARREKICAENKCGLTELYNQVDEGAYTDLKILHNEFGEAAAAAYGWPKTVAHDDEIVRRLLALNREIAAGTRKYDPFGTQAKVGTAMLFATE